MNKMMLLITSLLFAMVVWAEDNPAVEAMEEYLEVAECSEGSISTDQIASIDTESIFFVDTRNKGQYDAGHIPGAVNIEWREVLSRRGEIPIDKPVILYCERGMLSSKAHLALRISGRDNVKVLWGGYLM